MYESGVIDEIVGKLAGKVQRKYLVISWNKERLECVYLKNSISVGRSILVTVLSRFLLHIF